ncbi:MAG TPA: alpha/beta fold hydrolase [Casimicrobiaceae bacterium]|nr:alpha/beta fold hydrolase [Casimicrobiaceae bacterium]
MFATIVAGALLASGCGMLETKERELTWRPVRAVANWFSGVPAHVQDVYLPVSDGASTQRIHGWWWPAEQKNAPVVLYLHGARWNLTGQLRRIAQLRDFGFSVFAIDYRGFGASDGDLPSETTVYEDAQTAWNWITQRERDPSRRFIYGHSLGGAVAVELASRLSHEQQKVGGLIVESSFTSLADVASAMSYPWLPVGLILSQKFDSLSKIAELAMPVLIVHGANDSYVPPRLSEALYAAAPGPKKLLLVDGASHNNSMWVGEDEYRQAITQLFGMPAVEATRHAGKRG